MVPSSSSSSSIEMCMSTRHHGQNAHDDHDNNGNDGTTLIIGNNNDASNAAAAAAQATLSNFYIMSILFSTVPAAALACLSLATARLGLIGAWQSGILYLTYCLSALCGATWIVKKLGSRTALVLGMSLYCLYVTCFWLATLYPFIERGLALTGAGLGGIGAGIMWTSQGTYFAQAAHAYALETGMSGTASNSKLAGIFAFCLLVEETTFDLLSTLFIRVFGISWTFIFGLYTFLAWSATILLPIMVKEYPHHHGEATHDDIAGSGGGASSWNDAFYKATCAFYLLVNDSKMKYMIGFNASFGFCGAFLNSFVSGQVVPVALRDASASYVGLFVAVHGTVAAISSLLFGHLAPKIGNGPILSLGAVSFGAVAVPFLIQPNLEQWTWAMLLFIYSAEGVGRATFESTLKAVFADFFYYEKEGAFANIILQNGISSAIAYVMSFRLTCNNNATNVYCIEYRDSSHHDILVFGMMIILTSIAAILGYWRALHLFHSDAGRQGQTTRQTRPMYASLNYSPNRNSVASNPNADNVTVDWEASPEIEVSTSSHLPQIA
jgi:Major Facilitator Superfamily